MSFGSGFIRLLNPSQPGSRSRFSVLRKVLDGGAAAVASVLPVSSAAELKSSTARRKAGEGRVERGDCMGAGWRLLKTTAAPSPNLRGTEITTNKTRGAEIVKH